MYFIDLEKLGIKKGGLYKTKELTIDLGNSNNIFEIKQIIRDSLNYFFEETSIETLFKIQLEGGNHITDLDEADAYFITVVNIFSAIFFDSLCIPKGRPRERRLDVPEELKKSAVSLSLLKKAINYQTYYQRLNLSITWSIEIFVEGEKKIFDFKYDLIPEAAENDN